MPDVDPAAAALPADAGTQRRRARRVTYGAVAVLLCTALVQAELWPLTAYRLFSTVRTGTGSYSELVAVAPDGERTVLRLSPDNPVVRTTAHLYPDLPDADPQRQAAMVRAWLVAAGLAPAEVATVTLERGAREMDPRTGRWREVSRHVVVEVRP